MAKARPATILTCVRPGLTIVGIAAARTFAPGDQIDPDAVIGAAADGGPLTWRDALGGHLASHFTGVQTSALPVRAPAPAAAAPEGE